MTGLVVEKLRSWYGYSQALFDVSLRVETHEVVGLLGRNGAGKTTTLRSIARVQRKVAGRVSLDDRDLVPLSPNDAARGGVTIVGEGAGVFAKMSVEENLELAQSLARRRRVPPRPLDDVWSWFPPLHDSRGRSAGVLSGGQRRMLALSAAFVSAPRLLLLDEPSGGLSDTVAAVVFGVIEEVCREGMTVLIAEQRPELLERFVPRAYMLDEGITTHEMASEQRGGAGPPIGSRAY